MLSIASRALPDVLEGILQKMLAWRGGLRLLTVRVMELGAHPHIGSPCGAIGG